MGRVLRKEDYKNFLLKLQKAGELVAPITTDITRFQVVENVDDVDLKSGNPFFPIKKYFLPNEEVLFNIEKGKTKEVKLKPVKRIIFGARLCDINGIAILDRLYLSRKFTDKIYKQKRENTIIVGVNCLTPPSENCFCGSMDLQKTTYDLLLHERKNDYYIDVLTKKGEALVKHLPKDNFDYPLPKTSKKLDKKNLWPFFADKSWNRDSDLCVSCQRCTILCPTCYCFDIYDKVNLQGGGERIRTIDSCHSKDFTEVAGGHVFRDKRVKQYRHRVMHKVQFFEDKFKRSMCTGCGRCIQYCHSKIDFVKSINDLKGGKK
ncbi:MAG: 4Fe-4S dicluster domain-containing protein [archaeon]